MSHPTRELTLDLRQPNDPHFTDKQTEFLKCNAQPAWLSVQAIKAAQTPGLLALRPALCLVPDGLSGNTGGTEISYLNNCDFSLLPR